MGHTFKYTHQLLDSTGEVAEEVMESGQDNEGPCYVDHYTWYAGGRSITQSSLRGIGWTVRPLDEPKACTCKACGEPAPIQEQPDEVDREWQREQAMQAGMAFGCDAYNEVMGYD